MSSDKKWHNYNEINKFDIVYTFFPYLNKNGERIKADKCHYCLVLDKPGYDPVLKVDILTVAYGTSKFTKYKMTDLMVDLKKLSNPNYTGLFRDTKFELHNRVPLGYTYENFKAPSGFKDPIVGCLDFKNEIDLNEKMKEIAKNQLNKSDNNNK